MGGWARFRPWPPASCPELCRSGAGATAASSEAPEGRRRDSRRLLADRLRSGELETEHGDRKSPIAV